MLTLLTPPTVEPVTINEAKAHARIAIVNGVPITSLTRASGVVTAVVPGHGLIVGQQVIVDNALDPTFSGLFVIATAADGALTWSQAGINAATAGGTIGQASPEDSLIADLIAAAREEIENLTHTALITQKWTYSRDGFPRFSQLYEPQDGGFYLPKPPFQSLTEFRYIDMNGVAQILGSSLYQVNAGDSSNPARVYAAYLTPWPVVRKVPNNVIVDFVCGYETAADIPTKLKLAIKKTFSDWYFNRERVGSVPEEIVQLVSEYRNLLS